MTTLYLGSELKKYHLEVIEEFSYEWNRINEES